MPTMEPPRDDFNEKREASDLSISTDALKAALAKAAGRSNGVTPPSQPVNSTPSENSVGVKYPSNVIKGQHPDDIMELARFESLINPILKNPAHSKEVLAKMLLDCYLQYVTMKRMWVQHSLGKLDDEMIPNMGTAFNDIKGQGKDESTES